MFYLTGCGRGTFSHRIFDCHCGCCGPFAHHFVGRYHTFGHEMSKKSCQTSESRCYWIWETSQIKKWWRFEQYRYYNCYSGKCCLPAIFEEYLLETIIGIWKPGITSTLYVLLLILVQVCKMNKVKAERFWKLCSFH